MKSHGLDPCMRSWTVAIVANSDEALYRFRMPLIRGLVDRCSQVYTIAPNGNYVSQLESTGATFVPWQLSRGGLNPLRELHALAGLWSVYRKVKPTLAQHFTVKPNVYGAIAARLARVPYVVASVTGLGYAFGSGQGSRVPVRTLVSPLYKTVSVLSDFVTFQNQEDIDELTAMRLVATQKARLLPGGSGVDIKAYSPDAVDDETEQSLRRSIGVRRDSRLVSLVARMLWDKGVGEFVESARRVRSNNPNVEFLLIGPTDPGNRSEIPAATLDEWHKSGVVRYLGRREDVRDLMAISDIVSLPSSYREGVPHVLLQAAAMGKAIVTTDMPGCRDVVEHGKNGLLIQPNDPGALADAFIYLLTDDTTRSRFAQESRRIAVERFSEEQTVRRYLDLYEQLATRVTEKNRRQ